MLNVEHRRRRSMHFSEEVVWRKTGEKLQSRRLLKLIEGLLKSSDPWPSLINDDARGTEERPNYLIS